MSALDRTEWLLLAAALAAPVARALAGDGLAAVRRGLRGHRPRGIPARRARVPAGPGRGHRARVPLALQRHPQLRHGHAGDRRLGAGDRPARMGDAGDPPAPRGRPRRLRQRLQARGGAVRAACRCCREPRHVRRPSVRVPGTLSAQRLLHAAGAGGLRRVSPPRPASAEPGRRAGAGGGSARRCSTRSSARAATRATAWWRSRCGRARWTCSAAAASPSASSARPTRSTCGASPSPAGRG